MARSGNSTNFIPRSAIRIVVAGDAGTGKSSLIISAATNSFPGNIPNVLPPTHLSPDYYSDRVPLIIIDTSSSPGSTSTLVTECNMADVIVLTYAYDRPGSMDRLGSYWLPELRRLEVKVPVIVVGCKLDLRDESNSALEHVLSPIMQQFREIEMCIECSALLQIQVHEVFFFAHKAVLYPTSTLFDQETQSLNPRCASALKRIFNLCDHDRDGALSDADINDFQIKCFNAPLQPLEIAGLREVVQENTHDGVNEHGLTLIGFQYLHALFMERGRPETTWTVLRKFGYSDELKLKDDLFSANFKRAPDQSVELTTEAIEFLKRIFVLFDSDNDGVLEPAEIDDLFSTAPESPWSEYPYKDAAERNVLGGLSLEGFLSQWNLMTLLDPVGSLANLICIGYENDQALAYRMTRRRRQDRKKQQSLRNVLQCFVFGPKNSGKSALISSLIARPFSERWISTTSEQFAANVVELPGGIKKTLVMREIPEDSVNNLLSNRESLAACDIAVFVHDSSDASSFKKATELLIQVASHGENSGFEVPCLIISSKDDLHSYPLAIQDSTRVSHDMGIEMPIPVSSKLSDLNNVFCRIVAAAQRPHLSIPETEAGRTRKQYRQLVNRSLMCVSVGAAITVVGLGAYRVYASRKNSSR